MKAFRIGLSAVVTVAASMAPAVASADETAPAPFTLQQAAGAFGARESVLQASLSPDSKLLATLEPYGARGMAVMVSDLSVTPLKGAVVLAASGDPDRIEWCRWSGVRRLVCSAYGIVRLDSGALSYITRLIAVDADGKRVQTIRIPARTGQSLGYTLFGGSVIDWNTGQDGHILIAREYVPEASVGTHMAQRDEGLGVDDVNSVTLGFSKIERARTIGREYISDGLGHVRIIGIDPEQTAEGYTSEKTRYLYRSKDKSDLLPLGDYDGASRTGFNPYYVDPVLDVAYGLKKVDGRLAAYSVSLDGKNSETLILARPDVDVDGFVTIGRNRRVIGVTYGDEATYFDPALKRLATSLSKAIPDLPIIRFVDSSQDERRLLIWAGSDVDPGRYYLFDRDKHTLDIVAYSRLSLINRPLASQKSVQVRATDGTLISAYLTLPPGSDGKNLPAIVLPHGGPSARDRWGFDWLPQFWANRGYAVLQPNYRGSTGYGDDWFQSNGFQSWRVAIGDVIDSGRWLVEQGIANPAKLAIVGWSYGGYAALQSAATRPELFRAVIAIAPVTDLGRLKEEWRGFTSYRVQRDFIGSGAHIEEGSPARQAGKITAPVLMFHGTYDRNVSVNQSQFMADRLRAAGRQGRLVSYEKLDHYLEDGVAREDMLKQSAEFLEKSFAIGH